MIYFKNNEGFKLSLKYGNKCYNEKQQKLVDNVIKSIMKGFNLENIPECDIQGLDIKSMEHEFEESKETKTPKELKDMEKLLKFRKSYYGNMVKVLFRLNDVKKLCYNNEKIQTNKYYVDVHLWTGVFDFSIPSPFIFGRACKRRRHGGGHYFFYPLNLTNFPILDLTNKIKEKFPELFPYDIVGIPIFIDLLKNGKLSKHVSDQLKNAYKNQSYKEMTNDPLVNQLNLDKKLINQLILLPHFGNTEEGITKYVSDVDVSILFFPFENTTLFQIIYFGFFKKKSGIRLKFLIDSIIRCMTENLT